MMRVRARGMYWSTILYHTILYDGLGAEMLAIGSWSWSCCCCHRCLANSHCPAAAADAAGDTTGQPRPGPCPCCGVPTRTSALGFPYFQPQVACPFPSPYFPPSASPPPSQQLTGPGAAAPPPVTAHVELRPPAPAPAPTEPPPRRSTLLAPRAGGRRRAPWPTGGSCVGAPGVERSLILGSRERLFDLPPLRREQFGLRSFSCSILLRGGQNIKSFSRLPFVISGIGWRKKAACSSATEVLPRCSASRLPFPTAIFGHPSSAAAFGSHLIRNFTSMFHQCFVLRLDVLKFLACGVRPSHFLHRKCLAHHSHPRL